MCLGLALSVSTSDIRSLMDEYQLVVYVYLEGCCSKVHRSVEYQECIAGCIAYNKLPVQEDNKPKGLFYVLDFVSQIEPAY